VFDYFDLNKRAQKSAENFKKKVVDRENEEKRKMDLGVRGEMESTQQIQWIPIAKQIVLYVGLFLGVIVSGVVSQFIGGQELKFNVSVGLIIVSAIIAIAIMPQVYQNLNPQTPFPAQLGIFVQNGIFWNAVWTGIAKVYASTIR
jgi:hypothetical protein